MARGGESRRGITVLCWVEVMNRKEQRDAKNARHKVNEQRRFDRKIDKIWKPWRDMMAESARYAELNMTETIAVK